MIPIGLIILSFLLLAGGASSLGISALVFGRRLDSLWAKPLAILGLIAGFFMGTYLLELNSTGLEAKLFWGYAQYISKVFLPVSYLAFTLAYTENKWYRPRLVALLSVIPLLSLYFLWFDVNDMMYTTVQLRPSPIGPNVNADYGWWFWVFVGYSYSLLGIGTAVLLHAIATAKRGLSRLQMGILSVSGLLPGAGALITVLDLIEIDVTPLFVGVMAVTMAFALLRLRLFDIEPTRMAILEKMNDGFLSVDLSNRVIDFNMAARRLLKRSTWEMRNSSLANFTELSQVVHDKLDQVDFYGRLEETFTIDRQQRRFAIYVSPLLNQDQTPYGRLIFLRDITERSRLQQSQNNIIRALIHDLRSPISTTIGMLEMLKDDVSEGFYDPQETTEVLSRSNNILRRNIYLIEQTLELNRLESGTLQLMLESVNIEMIWQDLAQLMSQKAAKKGIGLKAHIPADLPLVKIDRLHIHRVVQNLMDNALKFAPENSVLELRARPINHNGHPQITVSIFNSGSTVPEDLKHLLFEKFIHGPDQAHGFGLGLAFCKTVLEAHGEMIWLERSDEKGTMFSFTLPIDLNPQSVEKFSQPI